MVEEKKKEEKLGDRIKKIRKALKMSQISFSAQLGSSATSFSEIENNKYKPGFEILFKLATEYNANLYYLFFGKGEMFLDIGKDPLTQMKVEGEEFTRYELELLDYFTRSKICRFKLLGLFQQLLFSERAIFDAEIKGNSNQGHVV